MKHKLLFTVLCLVLVFSPAVFAKGVPTYFTIQGNNLPPMVIFFDEALVFDPLNEIASPDEALGEMYILRAFDVVDNEVIESQLSPMHYYPQADGTGIIYFVGAQDRGVGQEFDNNWYPAKTNTSQILNHYIGFATRIEQSLELLGLGF